jgi:tetratricopeptide (TPR) repeat protein
MQGRESWQALQARLNAARAAADRGDRSTALADITAALEIDPNFLAAHALRDRLLAEAAATAPAPPAMPASPDPALAADEDATASPVPGVSTEGYAAFQQRAKRRRLHKRVEAARDAITHGRVNDAAAALDEVIELDPKLPELFALTEQFDTLRRAEPSHRGPRFAAAAVFAGTLLGGSWLQDSPSLMSRPVMTAGMLPVAVPRVTVSTDVAAVATSGERDGIDAPTPKSEVIPELRAVPREAAASPASPVPEVTEPTRSPLPPAAPVAQPPTEGVRGFQPSETAAQSLRSPALREPQSALSDRNSAESKGERLALADVAVDESALVQKALQRYRLAYEELDAQSAQIVWPAVNQAALARAFDGLDSQTLTFDACDIRVSGDAATATCQGSARYVPKVGSREPRVEPRVWNFTLRKNGGEWKIDNARAER